MDDAGELFEPAAGTIYLDSATYGLPPRTTVNALQRALEQWRGGTGRWIEDWEAEGEACRGLFARLIHGRGSEVALLPAVSRTFWPCRPRSITFESTHPLAPNWFTTVSAMR